MSKYITANDTVSAHSGAAVTPSDSTILKPTRALWVGGAGDVAITMAGDGSVLTLVGVPAGSILPVQATKVMSTNTSATNIVALY